MPDAVKPKRQVMVLKMPCPKCKGRLEQEVLREDEKRLPRVRCSACKLKWASYRDMLKNVGPKKITLDNAQDALVKVRGFIRGGRNVVERLRAAQSKLKSAAVALRNIKKEGATSEVGASLEGIVEQMILGLDDVKDAVKGKTKDFVGDKAGVEEEEGDDRGKDTQ